MGFGERQAEALGGGDVPVVDPGLRDDAEIRVAPSAEGRVRKAAGVEPLEARADVRALVGVAGTVRQEGTRSAGVARAAQVLSGGKVRAAGGRREGPAEHPVVDYRSERLACGDLRRAVTDRREEPELGRDVGGARPDIGVPEIDVAVIGVVDVRGSDILRPSYVALQGEPMPLIILDTEGAGVVLRPPERRPGAEDAPLRIGPPLL